MSKKLVITLIIISMIICSAITLQQVSSDTTAQSTQLKIYTSLPSIPADNSTYNCIFVQLLDSNGIPARAQQETTISLTSSLTEIGTADQTITIQNGATYGSANFYTTFTPGTTIISASATGYKTVQASVTTVGPKPYTIAVYGFPSVLPADGDIYEAIMVQLQDSNGAPAKAPNGGTQVTLSCSNTTVGDVTPTVTILEGQTYTKANFTTTPYFGQADITPVAGDYISQKTKIQTNDITGSSQLRIFTGPAKVLADNIAYRQIAVEIIDKNGQLGVAPYDIVVTIASSDQSIGTTETQIIIPRSESYALATLTTTYKAGATVITAAATNYEAASETITTTGYTASKLGVYLVPSSLPADKAAYQAIQVQLQDSQGHPAKAPTDLTVKLFSSTPTVAAVSPTVTISAGKTCTTGTLTATNAPGQATVTAQASSYVTSQATVETNTIDLSSLQVTLTADPQSIPNGNKTEITAYITAEGSPITGASIRFASNNNGSFTAAREDQAGYYKTNFTAASFSRSTTCTITANASKTGFISAQGTTQITVVPPSTIVASTNSTGISVSIHTLLLLVLDSDGNLVVDAQVSSVAQPSGSQVLMGFTNTTGYATFANVKTGSYTFEIAKDGYQTMDQTVDFSGNQQTMTVTLASSPQDNTLLIIGAVIAVVVVVVVSVVLVKRRKPAGKKLEPLSWPMAH